MERVTCAAWLLALLFFATLAAAGLMYLVPLSVAGCGDRCDYFTLSAALRTFFILVLLPLMLAIAGTYFLRRRGWWVILAPITGFLLLGILYGITYDVARTAMRI
ncbi:hypothetical protein ACFM35_00045 [Microbacterium sp. P01]|uniref:hypothetical protein n=1 Tax=Microbacterium sp. P01 TaxID=3366261 RepID=UPI0036717E43